MNVKNTFLNRVNVALRKQRMPIPSRYSVKVRQETFAGSPYAALWFRTRGCRYDRAGECTMCNYGQSSDVVTDEILAAVRMGLMTVKPDDKLTLFVSPSGSLFDDLEVMPDARERIFELANEFQCSTFQCESRPEFLDEERLSTMERLLHAKQRIVEMGVESATPWVLKYSVGKTLPFDTYHETTERLRSHGIRGNANVMLGAPFLSPRETIADTVSSVRWALANGTDTCIVFPIHVKRWTFIEWLAGKDLYKSPSLWSLVEAITQLGPEILPRLRVSWYKNRFTTVNAMRASSTRVNQLVEDVVVQSPTTCPACYDQVIALLDELRVTLQWSTIEKLQALECDCKQVWRASVEARPAQPLFERLTQAYELAGREILGEDWWSEHGTNLIDPAELPAEA